VRPPWVTTSHPPSSRRTSIDGDNDALRAVFLGTGPHEFGVIHGRGVERHLVGTGAQHPPRVIDGPHSAADRERNEDFVGDALDDMHHRVARVARRSDVEEHELVGALGVVARRELDRIAGIADAHEVDALHHATGVDVEARDHADSEHAAIPSATVKRPS
jgi:hypothetical protein